MNDSAIVEPASFDSAVRVEQPWKDLVRLADQRDATGLEAFISSLSTSDQALALSRLDQAETELVLRTLRPDHAAELICHLSEAQAALTVGALDAATAASIVQELPSDVLADVLGDLKEEQVTAILDSFHHKQAAMVRELAAYDDNVAGGLMVSELLRFDVQMSVADVIEQLSHDQEEYDDHAIRYGYVCDDDGTLVGVLPMRNLLFAKRSSRIGDIMIRDPLFIADTMPLADLIEFFDTHNFLGVPVVDSNGVLKGIVNREAVDHAAVLAGESDYLKSQGIVGGEELRSMPLWLRARRRLSWLSVNVLLNIGAASIVALFQETLQAVIALAVFLPIISDMSGCSGNQAVAVSMRELSLGLVRPSDVFRVWMKEFFVGLINGAALGLLVALAAVAYNGNPYLGLVVGVALFLNTIVAVSIGGTVPLLVKRLGFDPAVASGPLLTTVTDMCGFFLVLGMATLMLAKLTS